MVHADHETRVGAHRIFSVVLVPSSVSPQPSSSNPPLTKATDIQRMLSRNVSVFSSSAALFEKLERKQNSMLDDSLSDGKSNDNSILNRLKSSYSRTTSIRRPSITVSESSKINNPSMMNRLKSNYSRVTSVKRPQSAEENATDSSDKQQVCTCTYFLFTFFLILIIIELINQTQTPSDTILLITTMSQVLPIRLSSHQITLLLSSLWVQSIYPVNTPENFEAISHTYSLVLLVARSKVTDHSCHFTM